MDLLWSEKPGGRPVLPLHLAVVLAVVTGAIGERLVKETVKVGEGEEGLITEVVGESHG